MSSIHSHVFSNGLALLAEPIPSLESAAFTLFTPAGCAYDPAERGGLSAMVCEMALRGCGARSSRQFIEDLENLGVEHGESVSDAHTSYSGATLAKNLPQVLSIYADLLRRPHMPADQLEAGRLAAIQELRAIEDEPGHKVMLELKRRHYPAPYGRPSEGDMASLEAITIDEIQAQYAKTYRPNGTILGVAGRIDWPQLRDQVESLLGEWPRVDMPELQVARRGVRREHLDYESIQTQIGIAYDSIPYNHPDYFQASGAVGVLSGGFSSRLFSEVREKRGLCYTVYASYHTLRDRGSVMCYSGTSSENAQQTLDVILQELNRLPQGILPDELKRLKTRVKSGLVTQQESSYGRSSAVARDWYHLGRVRTLEEVGKIVDALTVDSINAYLAKHPPGDFSIVTLGPKPLNM